MEQAKLLAVLIGERIRGLVAVPHIDSDCERVQRRFLEWVAKRDEALQQVIDHQTADEHLQERLHDILAPLTRTDVQRTSAASSLSV